MKSLRWLICLAAIGGTVVASTPDAEAARRSSLAGNRLILDKNDVLFFPQLSVNYTNLLSVDMGPGAASGAGLAILGSETMAFGIGVHRGDIFESPFFPHTVNHPQLGEPPNLLGSLGFPGVHTVFDLFGGMEIGPGLIGARLALGTGGGMFDPADRNQDIDSERQTFFLANLGFSLTGEFRLDTGLSFLVDTGNIIANGDDIIAATNIQLALGGRGYMPMAQGVDLGFIADLNFSSTAITGYEPAPGFDGTASEFGLVAGAGPVYDIAGMTRIAGYAVLGLRSGGQDPDLDGDDDESSFFIGILPGLQLAADIHLTDWLYFRTGMQYLFGVGSEAEATPNGDDITRGNFSQFGWRAGLGLNVGNFSLDGAFTSGFLTSGPDFIGGQGPGLFTMVNAQYSF